jgi:predicted ATP-dependent serine protease
MKDMFNYECKHCGHTWSWAYLFVLKCPKCRHYGCFNDFEEQAIKTGDEARATSTHRLATSKSPRLAQQQHYYDLSQQAA